MSEHTAESERDAVAGQLQAYADHIEDQGNPDEPVELHEPCELATPHGRHLVGTPAERWTCPGREASQELETYSAMLDQYASDQRAWLGPAQLPLLFHLRKLGRKLDADPAASASLSSAFLQAYSRLDKQRPGNTQPAGHAGDLPGQGSIFDELD